MRSFAPTGHRHTAEILQAVWTEGHETQVHLSATAVDNVRGVLATAHLFAKAGVEEKDIWRAYRHRPIVTNLLYVWLKKKRASTGILNPRFYRGSNYADIGFELG